MNQSKLLQESQQDKEAIIKEENGSIYVWGSNNHGQLGLGDTFIGKTFALPKPLTFNMFIQEVACGEDHAVFLTSRGQIYTMGSNAEGRLGLGNKNIERSSIPTLLESSSGARCMQIACGWGHTLAVMDSGEVFSWGTGESGALGLGNTESAWSPTLVMLEEKTFLGTRKVSAGSTHSAFISELGTIYMCGAGDAGQLGTGKRDKELKPVQMTLISEKAKDVACGVFHTIILTERGKVYATGGNIFGQLGIGNKKSTNIPIRVKDLDYQRVTKIACGHHSAALTETGEIYVWGTGVFGEFVSPTKFSLTGQIFKDINLNGFFGAALDQNGHIWTWGSNTNGELGHGHYEPKTKPHMAEAIQDKKIEKFACGVSFVVALGEATGRNRRITPLKLRTQTPVHTDLMPLSNRTPQKIETPLSGQETLENKLIATTDLKAKMPTRQTLRTSSVGKPRGEGYESSSTRRGMNSRPREVSGFIDLLGRDKTGEEEGTKKEKLNDLDLIEKLLKQKEVLEKALNQERTEKKGLEQDLGELKQRLSRLQEGPEGLAALTENFNRQSRKFDELKGAYGEEIRRREKLFKDLQQEQQANKDLCKKIDDRDDAITKLQVKADQGAIAQKRVVELENNKQRLTQQIETLEFQAQEDLSEINRQKAINLELENVVSQKNDVIQRVEEERQTEFNEKKGLQREVADLTLKIQELENRLDRTTKSFDREKEARLQVEEELLVVKHKEESAREQISRLAIELEDTKSVFERRLQDEEENKAKMQEDINILEQDVQDLREECAILNDEKNGLEDELLESQQKNRRLLELFNEEIDKQNQALNRKPANPVKLTDLASQKPVREVRNPTTAEKSEEKKSPYRSRLDQSREEKTNVFGKADNSMTTPTGAESGNFMFRSVDKSQYLPQEEADLKKSQTLAPTNEENQVFRLEYDSFGSPNKEIKQQQTPEVPEDRHRKASESPKKRQATLDLTGDNSRNIGPYEVYGQTEHSQLYTPERDRSTVLKETGSYSGNKRKSASPTKNFSIADYRSRGSEISDGKDFLEDLKEVQEKMEALERNKRELQSRMQDFETRFTVGENKQQ